MPNFTNNAALVTGAARGTGRATARPLAAADAYVIVHFGNAKAEAETAVGIQDALICSFALIPAIPEPN